MRELCKLSDILNGVVGLDILKRVVSVFTDLCPCKWRKSWGYDWWWCIKNSFLKFFKMELDAGSLLLGLFRLHELIYESIKENRSLNILFLRRRFSQMY